MKNLDYKEIIELYKQAIKLWGKEFQFIMLVEESSELFKELSKDLRNPNFNNRDKILEEITDLEIMLSQISVFYKFNKYESNSIYIKKIIRLKERVEKQIKKNNINELKRIEIKNQLHYE